MSLTNYAGEVVTSGTAADFDNQRVLPVTDFACGGGHGIGMALTEPGGEVVPVAADGTTFIETTFTVMNSPGLTADPDTGGAFNPNKTPLAATVFLAEEGYRSEPLGSAMAPDHLYSLVLMCMNSNSTPDWSLMADASGSSIATWVRIQTDASSGWTLVVPKTDTTVELVGAQEGVNDAKLTATVKAAGAVAADAAGTVEFYSDGTKVGSGSVTNGVATATLAGLADGSHSYTATYVPASGANFTSSSSAAVTVSIAKVRTVTTVVLTGSASGWDTVKLAATVQAGGAAAETAAGTIEFWSGSTKIGESTVANGAAAFTVTGLTDGTSYSYTAKYVPSSAETTFAGSTSASAAVAVPALPAVLKDGSIVETGSMLRVEFPAGTFAAGTTLTGEVHSDPITLTETAIVNGDGSARYVFTVPAALAAGTSHELVVTDGTTTKTVAFSIKPAAVDDAAPTKPGVNTPVSFATDWVAATSASPVGVLGAIASLLALAGAAAASGWFLLRRRARQA